MFYVDQVFSDGFKIASDGLRPQVLRLCSVWTQHRAFYGPKW